MSGQRSLSEAKRTCHRHRYSDVHDPIRTSGAIWKSGATDIWPGQITRPEASDLDHLAPFLGFVDNELGEVGRRGRKHIGTQAANSKDLFIQANFNKISQSAGSGECA